MNNRIKEKIIEIYPKVVNYRRHLHSFPELSFEEFKTTEYIIHILETLGIDYERITETGVVAYIGSMKSSNCVAIRADIDALPIIEETDLEYKSQNLGTMHACGHDMHTAMMLGSCEILKSYESEIDGLIKIIFQPAEEKLPGGASQMIQAGVLVNPKPKAIFGQHIYPSLDTGKIAINSGYFFASTDEFYWTIKGKGGHAAQPHLSNDPIMASVLIINYYQSMMVKFKNPLKPGVLTVASIQGGNTTNIFPDVVRMKGTLRAFDEEWRADIKKLIIEKSKLIAELYDCQCEIEIVQGYPSLINNEETTSFVTKTAKELFGEENVIRCDPIMYAEDFSYYSREIPATFWFVGVKSPTLEDMPPLHNSKIAPDEEAMLNGMELLINSAIEYLKKED